MKFFVLCSIISMNLFIVVSTFAKEVLKFPIEPLYYPSMMAIAVITVFYVLYQMVVTKKLYVGVIVFALVVLFYLITYYISPFKDEKLAKNTLTFFIMWAIPAALAGIYIKDFKREKVERFFKVVFFVFALTFFAVILIPKLIGALPSYINFGLMNYQNASYLAAFTVGLGIYFIIKGLTKHNWIYVVVTVITMPSVFIPGGRGGAILLILYFLITFIIITFNRGIPVAVKGLMYIFAALISSVAIYYIFTKATDSRTFSYLQGGSINLDGTSGRGPIYQRGIQYIQESPFFGYGPFNYYHLVQNIPHNVIIESLLTFGAVGLLIAVLILGYYVYKFIINYDSDSIDLLVIFIAVYPITILMFSTNYLVVSEFWFVLFYLITKGRRHYGKA